MDFTLGVPLHYGHLRLELKLRRLHQNSREGVVGVVRAAQKSSGGNEASSGDPNLQQKLVEIIRLETGKARVSDYIEEQAKVLSDIAEQAIVGSDQIASDALKDFDEASAKTMKAIDEGFQAVEEQLATDLAEINSGEEDLDAFEKSIQDARSQGLFFKGLYKPLKRWKDRDPDEQRAIREEAKQLAETTGTLLQSKSRKNLYILLILIMGLLLVESVTTAEHPLSGIIVSTVMISLLSIQLISEKSISPEKGDAE